VREAAAASAANRTRGIQSAAQAASLMLAEYCYVHYACGAEHKLVLLCDEKGDLWR